MVIPQMSSASWGCLGEGSDSVNIKSSDFDVVGSRWRVV